MELQILSLLISQTTTTVETVVQYITKINYLLMALFSVKMRVTMVELFIMRDAY